MSQVDSGRGEGRKRDNVNGEIGKGGKNGGIEKMKKIERGKDVRRKEGLSKLVRGKAVNWEGGMNKAKEGTEGLKLLMLN